jgi:hypothetical protein
MTDKPRDPTTQAVGAPAWLASFDAALDDLETALRRVPDAAWETSVWEVKQTDAWMWPRPGVAPIPERTLESIQRQSAFWAVAYHCVWFLDQYSSATMTGLASLPEARGGPEELPFPAADGAASIRGPAVSRDVLLRYLDFGRRQLHERIGTVDLTERIPTRHPHAGKTLAQLYEVNLAHVREHGGQLLTFANLHGAG